MPQSTPRCDASPKPFGWSTPLPSTRMTSGASAGARARSSATSSTRKPTSKRAETREQARARTHGGEGGLRQGTVCFSGWRDGTFPLSHLAEREEARYVRRGQPHAPARRVHDLERARVEHDEAGARVGRRALDERDVDAADFRGARRDALRQVAVGDEERAEEALPDPPAVPLRADKRADEDERGGGRQRDPPPDTHVHRELAGASAARILHLETDLVRVCLDTTAPPTPHAWARRGAR